MVGKAPPACLLCPGGCRSVCLLHTSLWGSALPSLLLSEPVFQGLQGMGWLSPAVKSARVPCLVTSPGCLWAPLPTEQRNSSKRFCGFANRGSFCAAPSGGQSQAWCLEQEIQQGSFILLWGGREPRKEGLGQWHRLLVKAVRISSRCIVPSFSSHSPFF